MAFGELKLSKHIALNSPKYATIIEPFGDNGTFALYLKKKRPKQHILNYESEDMFKIMIIIQNMTASDFKNLKSRDWHGSVDSFNKVVSINAIDGLDFFYKYFYLKEFSERQLNEDAPPVFDVLKIGMDITNFLFSFKLTKIGLKGVTILNQDYKSVISMSGQNPFYILVPKTPEQQDFVKGKIAGLGNFFYAKKSLNNTDLIDTARSETINIVSTLTISSIMMQTMQVITNYENRLIAVDIETIDAGENKNGMVKKM